MADQLLLASLESLCCGLASNRLSYFQLLVKTSLVHLTVRMLRRCVALAAAACATSPLLGQAPVITAPPLTKAAIVGQQVTFSVSVTGAAPVNYQWTRNGDVISGATGATLSIASATRADHGWYRLTISNASGVARSVFALHVASGKGAVERWGVSSFNDYGGVPPGLGPVVAAACGWRSYALKPDGSVFSWLGTTLTEVFSGGMVALSAYSHVLALRSEGTVVAAGENFDGQATVPAGLVNIVAASAGYSHSLVLRSDGTVALWGSNSSGQLNLPSGLTDVVAISAGAGHNLALKADGTVVGWGNNFSGAVSIPAGLTNVAAISAGGGHSLALKRDGTVVAWGANERGQCNVPSGLNSVEQIATGELHSVALKTDGTIVAWGDNSRGQVSGANGAKNISAIAAGTNQTLALFPAVAPVLLRSPANFSVAPAGVASFHVVATGTRPLDYRWKKNGSPVVIPTSGRINAANGRLVLENVQADDAGSYTVEVYNAAGIVASSAGVLTVSAPPVISSRPLSQLIAAGQSLTATIGVNGTGPFTYQWRRNGAVIPGATSAIFNVPSVSMGDRGGYEAVVSDANSNSSRSVFHVDVTPVAFSRAAVRAWTSSSTSLLGVPEPLSDVVAISAGGKFSLAVRRDGSVVEWGEDYYNQASVPVGLNSVVAAEAGTEQAVVLKADGTLAYWGPNAGSLFPPGTRDIVAVAVADYGWVALRADGTLAGSYSMEQYIEAAALTDIVAITRGYALRANGTVAKCFPWVAEPPADLTNVTMIVGGAQHALALKSDGTVVGWGTGSAALVPAGLAGISRIDAGANHSLAITTGGTLVTWGDNSNGQRNAPAALGAVLAVSGGERHTIALVPSTSPVIATHPGSQTVIAGTTLTLAVSANGSPPFFYQWRKFGSDIVGATQAQLVISDAIESDSGVYTVRVQNSGGSVVSDDATILVQEPNIAPVVRRAPQSVALMGTGSATFSLVAGGASPRAVQWYFGNTGDTSQAIVGATELSLTVNSATQSQRVWARVTNPLGSTDSPAAIALRWEKANAGLGDYDLLMASYANGRFFLASDYFIGSSTDAVTWSKVQRGGRYGDQIAYGNGVYVKTGEYYSSAVHTSVDGVSWVARPEAGMPGAVRVVFNGRLFVAVAGDRSLKASPDGITWTERLPPGQYLAGIAFGGGKLVAVGGGNSIYTSTDGVSWSTQTLMVSLERIIYANGRFTASTGNEMWTSVDAVTWTRQAAISVSALGGGGGALVAAHYVGDLLVSTDAASWARFPGMLPGYSGTAHLTYGGGRFLVTTWDGEFLRSLPLMGAITVQNLPAVPAVVAGNAATLSVSATGAGVQYQWYRGWSGDLSQPIAGATGPSYMTPALTAATPYWVRVSNATESVDSTTFNVVIATPPTIASHPRRMDVFADFPAALSVAANSTPVASYQWYAGGSGDASAPIAGAINANYFTPLLTTTASFWAKASTAAGDANSEAAVVTPWSLLAGQVPATSVAYFAGRYFAATGMIMSSVDGTSWAASLGSSPLAGFRSLTQGNGLLMAIGNTVAVTADGINWTEIAQETGGINGGPLAFGNGVFVAGSGSPAWSTDGRTWTAAPLENMYPHLKSVAFGNGRFVMVGDTSSSSPGSWVLLTSTDGKQWMRQPGPSVGPIAWLRDVAFTGAEFITVGNGRTILASADGQAWSRRPADATASDFRAIAFGSGVRVIGTGSTEYLRSTDGVSWTRHTAPQFFSGDTIEYVNGRFIAAGLTGWIFSSSDALTWTALTSWPFTGSTNQPRGLAVGNGRILLLSGDNAANGAARLFASTDGLQWSAANSPGPVNTELIFAQGAFYCGGANGLIYRTVDGAAWEPIPAGPSNSSIQSLTYNGREFLALTGNGGYVLNSLDGRAWSSREGPTIYGKHPIASSGSVHVTASNSTIYVSSDLENWARANVPPDTYNVEQIVYGNGVFVGYDFGGGGTILSSQDGATWSFVTLPAQFYPQSPKIAFANGRFWILTRFGFASSLNGRNWQVDDFDDAEIDRRGLGGRLPAAAIAEGEGMLLIVGDPWLMKASAGSGAHGITRPPAGAIIHAGQSASLNVETAGAVVAYQWFDGSTGDASKPITGANAASYSTPPLTQSRDYWVRVTLPFGVHSSATAHVEVVTPPIITQQPADKDAVPGGNATFTVVASGDAGFPLQYQWSFNGARIPGATNASYTVTGIQFAHVGDYSVVAFNAQGATRSRTAVLRGANPPVIQTQPLPATLVAGQSRTLSVSATSQSPLSYQWRRNGVAIIGATSTTYSLASANGAMSGYYDVVISDGFALTNSQRVKVEVAPSAYPQVLVPDAGFGARIEQAGGYPAGFLRLGDGRVVVFGSFSRINGTPTGNVARFAADGSIDATFGSKWFDGPVYAAAMQADGKLIVGGSFRRISGEPRPGLARLNSDGSLDATFAPAGDYVGTFAVAVQLDGKVVAGGGFSRRLVRVATNGSVDLAYPGSLDGAVYALAARPSGGVVVGGAFTTIGGVSRGRVAAITAEGLVEPSFAAAAGCNGEVYAIKLTADARVLVAGAFTTFDGSVANRIVRLTTAGTADSTWASGTGFSAAVYALEIQADGGILAGGAFTNYRGSSRVALARLASTGALDTGFMPVSLTHALSAVSFLADNSVLIGGGFSSISGSARWSLARLSATGNSLVAGFQPGLLSPSPPNRVLPLASGKLVIAGAFTHVDGVERAGLARLNADGGLDPTLSGIGPNAPVLDAIALANDQVIIAGGFTTYNGNALNAGCLAQVNANGSLDGGFAAKTNWPGSAAIPWMVPTTTGKFFVFNNGVSGYLIRRNADGSHDAGFNPGYSSSAINVAVEQPDGKVIVGGAFTYFNGWSNRLVRLLPTGATDLQFLANLDGAVSAIALQPDGRILVGGDFTLANGLPRTRIARLNTDGSTDASFNAGFGPNATVLRIFVQPDGRVMLLGRFTSVNGAAATSYIARLRSDGSVESTFALPGLREPPKDVALLDDGSLLVATNPLGSESSGGIGLIRLRTSPGPIIVAQPASANLMAGETHVLSAEVVGGMSVAYQWMRNDVAITGATRASLTFSSVQANDTANYSLRIVHAGGSLDSSTATVIVAASAPIIESNLVSGFGGAVRAGSQWPLVAPIVSAGSQPFSYQWQKDGNPISGATRSTFFPASWQPADAGLYQVTISNPLGSITSSNFSQLVTPSLDWEWHAPLPQGNPLFEARFLGQRFLLGGARGTLLTSADGESWQLVRLGTSNSVFAFAFGNGTYVALSGFGGIWTSNGAEWTQCKSPAGADGRYLNSIAFGAGQFVAVGGGGLVVRSADGIVWSEVATGISDALATVAFGAGRFVALGTDGKTYTSANGLNWNVGAELPRAAGLITFGQGKFVAAGATALFVSADGFDWAERAVPSVSPIRSLQYTGAGFLAALGTTAGRYLVSPDGELWTEKSMGTPFSAAPNALTYGVGHYFAVGTGAEMLVGSNDGVSWRRLWDTSSSSFTAATASASMLVAVGGSSLATFNAAGERSAPSVAFNFPTDVRDSVHGAGVWVAVGGAGRISTSNDAVSWETRVSGTTVDLLGVGFVANQFIGLGAGGTMLTSANGLDWVTRTSGVTQALHKVAFGGGIYVVVGTAGTVLTSTDALTWTPRSPNGITTDINDIIFAAGRFVLVSQGGSIRSSPDGVTWTAQINPLGAGLKSVVFAAGKFYAFTTGNTNYLWSAEGETWIAAQHGNANTTGDAVAFGDRLYLVGGNGSIVSLPLNATPPVIGTAPTPRIANVGSPVAFTVVATGTGPFRYQWFKDGVALLGAMGSTLSLSAVSPSDAGVYSAIVTNVAGSVTSGGANLTVNLIQPGFLASQARATAGATALRGAFTVEGSGAKSMLIRAVGPTLANFGITGFLADPTLTIASATTETEFATNNDWEAAANAAQVASVAAQIGAYPLIAGSKDAAVLATFAPGTYRVTVGPVGDAGVASLEIYDTSSTPRLVYVATRAQMGATGMFAQGIAVVAPPAGRTYFIRALGPSTGLVSALADPELKVFSGATQLAANDNWGGDAALITLANNVGAMPIPAASKEAALSFTPTVSGAYTIQVAGVGGASGTALLEVFESDAQRAASMPVALISLPNNLSGIAGQSASFGVVAVGKPAPTFQWSKNNNPIAGAVGSTLVIPSAQTADAGTYTVRVANGGPASYTAAAALVITPSNNATHDVLGRGYVAGGIVNVITTLHFVGAPASLNWSVELPAGWSLASDTSTANTKPLVNATGTLAWSWTTPPTSPMTFTYALNVPADETTIRPLATNFLVGGVAASVAPTILTIGPKPPIHSADTDGDYVLSLLELTRVIELYNTRNGTVRTGAYALALATTEDGFTADTVRLAPASATTHSLYHSADTRGATTGSPRDGMIDLLELTRVIELYNTRAGTVRTGRYHVQQGTEDGFAAGP